MVLENFENPTTLRFATLDLVKTDWKRYNLPLNKSNSINSETSFEIGAVNIFENETRQPVNYILPRMFNVRKYIIITQSLDRTNNL